MNALVADAKARVESNERLLHSTWHLLKVSWRRLYYPDLKIAGASGETDVQSAVRPIVRALLASGVLLPVKGRVTWAGYGSGKSCGVCGKPVNGSEVEYELDDGRSKMLGCHFACFVVWQEESRSLSRDGNTARQ